MATAAKTKRQAHADASGTQMVPVDEIVPPDINREDYGDIKELAESIKSQGLLQAITLASRDDGQYDLIIGERRWKATKFAGFAAIEAKIIDLNPVDRVLAQLSENIHRQELTPIERARQIENLFRVAAEHGPKLTQQDAANKLGFGSQSQVSKYRTLYRLYESNPSFKNFWDKGKLSFTDAIELSRLTKAPEKDVELITRVMADGIDKGNVQQAVKLELDQRAKQNKRAAKVKELESAGVTIASEDFQQHGGRRIGTGPNALDVDAKTHTNEPCHAVHVTATLEVQPVCTEPKRHANATQDAPKTPDKPKANKPNAPTGTTTKDDASKGQATESKPDERKPSKATESASDTDASNDEPSAEEQAKAEERAAEEAAKAAHAEALGAAGIKRRATMRAWLTGKGRLNRPMTDSYAFGMVVIIALEDSDVDQAIVRELLDLEDDGSTLDTLRQMADKNEEQLRRAAIALLSERVEATIEHDGNYRNPMADAYYRLLTDGLSYEPSEEEQLERGQSTPASAA